MATQSLLMNRKISFSKLNKNTKEISSLQRLIQLRPKTKLSYGNFHKLWKNWLAWINVDLNLDWLLKWYFLSIGLICKRQLYLIYYSAHQQMVKTCTKYQQILMNSVKKYFHQTKTMNFLISCFTCQYLESKVKLYSKELIPN